MSRAEIHRTLDGGLTWEGFPVNPVGACLTPMVIQFINSLEGWLLCAEAYQGQVWHSGDGGETWQLRHARGRANPCLRPAGSLRAAGTGSAAPP
jgi:photosystem II stability/assembly factor-like uncharacterized protein